MITTGALVEALGAYGHWDWSSHSSWNETLAYNECFIPNGVVMKKDSPPLTVPKKILIPNGQRKLILK